MPLRAALRASAGTPLPPVAEPGRFLVWIAPSVQSDGVQGGFDLLAG